jgi:AcrR family transcriptional regulator
MSESKGGSSGQSGRNARKPGGARKPTANARKSTARKPTKANGKAKQRTTAKIVPIYARLPRGPHLISAPGVARNQRIRIHGGMIEAVTTRGYPQTSVKLVVGLAGVSRRSFYEQFSGKEECFIATFDLIVHRVIQRLTHAYRAAEGEEPERMRAVLQAWGAELEQNPKALRLALADAQTAGALGLQRLQKTTAVCEGLLASALSGRCPPAGEEPCGEGGAARPAGAQAPAPAGRPGDEPEADSSEAMPPPVVRAIVGGLRRATQMRLLDDDTEDLGPLVGEMVKWSLLFKSPAVSKLRPRRRAYPPFPETLTLEPDACGGESRRGQVLRGAIDTGLRERKFADLSTPRIAESAGLPCEAVTELYPNPRTCYLEALDVLGDELLQQVASPELVSAEWPAAVCRAVDTLLAHLAGSPARLITLTAKALEAGPAAIANVGDLAYELATLLTEGAAPRPRTRIAIEGIAGGLWNIFYCEALAGRGHLLPMLSEYISYVVLTPYLGPDEAVAAIVRSRPKQSRSQPQAPGSSPAPAATANTSKGADSNGKGADTTGKGVDTTGKGADSNGNGVDTNGTTTAANNGTPAGEQDEEAYRRLAERRSAKCVNTTPTSTENTITTIKGA